MAMDKEWKQKKAKKLRRGSSTPGIAKGEICMANGLDKIMAKRNRSYKMRGYPAWCERMDRRAGISK